jgi:hypothetical protein
MNDHNTTNEAETLAPGVGLQRQVMPRSTPLPDGWPIWEGRRHLETLNQYLERMAQEGHTEFRLAIQETRPVVSPDTRMGSDVPRWEGHDVRFIIHPFNADGDTADFEAPHGSKPETSPCMNAFNVEPLSHGMTFEEWAAKVREVSYHDEDDGNLYDFFAEGYAVKEMPAILAERCEAAARDWD